MIDISIYSSNMTQINDHKIIGNNISKELEQILKQINSGNVLDIASGAGEFIHYIKEMKNIESITAIDSIEKMEEHIRARFPEEPINFLKMDAEILSFEAKTFDTVCISNSLHHFKDKELVVKEALRVLKPTGQLVINEMRSDELTTAQQSHDKLHRFFARLDQKRGMTHNETMKGEDIHSFLKQFDLQIVDQCEFSFPIPEEQKQEHTQYYLQIIDQRTEMLQEDPDYLKIKEEAEALKSHLLSYGFAQATSMLFVLKNR